MVSIISYKCPKIRTTLVVPGHTLTPMFSTVQLPSWALYKFLVPSMSPVSVVKAIIAALDQQHSQTIMMPFYTQFVPYLEILPSFLRDFCQWVSASCFSRFAIALLSRGALSPALGCGWCYGVFRQGFWSSTRWGPCTRRRVVEVRLENMVFPRGRGVVYLILSDKY